MVPIWLFVVVARAPDVGNAPVLRTPSAISPPPSKGVVAGEGAIMLQNGTQWLNKKNQDKTSTTASHGRNSPFT